jgi:hypothetical protein
MFDITSAEVISSLVDFIVSLEFIDIHRYHLTTSNLTNIVCQTLNTAARGNKDVGVEISYFNQNTWQSDLTITKPTQPKVEYYASSTYDKYKIGSSNNINKIALHANYRFVSTTEELPQILPHTPIINQCAAFTRELDLSNHTRAFDSQPVFDKVVTNCPNLKSLALYGFKLLSTTEDLTASTRNGSIERLTILSDNVN